MEEKDIKIPEEVINEDELQDKESEGTELRMFITEDEQGLTKVL